jgi:hypothetical protein
MSETVTLEPDFLCICGNFSESDGAYPCDSNGNLVEPTPDDWPGKLYRCDRCGRVFDGDTGEVIMQVSEARMKEEQA